MRASLSLIALVPAIALAACSSNTSGTTNDSNVMMANDSLMANDMMANDMMADNMMANTAMPADATPTDAASFIKMASASDLYEKKSAQLALDKSNSADIKDFAHMMITDHTKTTQAVKDAAAKANITVPPPQLSPEQQQMMAELQPLSGDAFDKAYLQQQMTAHTKALALLQNYAQNGDTPALRDAAKSAVDIVQKHISRLHELMK